MECTQSSDNKTGNGGAESTQLRSSESDIRTEDTDHKRSLGSISRVLAGDNGIDRLASISHIR